jgi:hypothetical protein
MPNEISHCFLAEGRSLRKNGREASSARPREDYLRLRAQIEGFFYERGRLKKRKG